MVLKSGIFEFLLDLGNFREFDQRNNNQVTLNQRSDFVVIKLFFEVNLFFPDENTTGLLDIEFILI